MHMNKERIRRQFDRHAKDYDQYAYVQRDLADKLIEMLPSQVNSGAVYNRILEIGCGTGYLSSQLTEAYPHASFVFIDLSPSMIEQTRKKLAGKRVKVKYIVEDAEQLIHHSPLHREWISTPYDLIISNATFQWFNEPRQTIKNVMELLSPHGIFAFSTFGPRTFHELHTSFELASQQLELTTIRHGQQFQTAKFWQTILAKHAVEVETFEQDWVRCYPNVREFLHQVKKVGAGNATTSSPKEAYSNDRELILQMEQYYAKNYAVPSGIQATYHVYNGIYKKNE